MVATITFRQERFVHESLEDRNASAAAVRAGYSARNLAAGSAVRTAEARRPRLAEKPQVLSGWPPAAQVDGEGADSIFARNVSCLLSSVAMPVTPRLRTAKRDQVLSGSRWAAPAGLAAA